MGRLELLVKTIQEKFETLSRSERRELYNDLSRIYEITEGQVRQNVHCWKEGLVYGTYTKPKNTVLQLNRLSIFLYELKISNENELIKELKNSYPLFSYPPNIHEDAELKNKIIRKRITENLKNLNQTNLVNLELYVNGLLEEQNLHYTKNK